MKIEKKNNEIALVYTCDKKRQQRETFTIIIKMSTFIFFISLKIWLRFKVEYMHSMIYRITKSSSSESSQK